jgi:hypothetical protein
MRVCLLAAAIFLAPSVALAQFPSGNGAFTPYGFGAQDAGAAAAIGAANEAIQQCIQKLRGRTVETVCTAPAPEPGKTK